MIFITPAACLQNLHEQQFQWFSRPWILCVLSHRSYQPLSSFPENHGGLRRSSARATSTQSQPTPFTFDQWEAEAHRQTGLFGGKLIRAWVLPANGGAFGHILVFFERVSTFSSVLKSWKEHMLMCFKVWMSLFFVICRRREVTSIKQLWLFNPIGR